MNMEFLTTATLFIFIWIYIIITNFLFLFMVVFITSHSHHFCLGFASLLQARHILLAILTVLVEDISDLLSLSFPFSLSKCRWGLRWPNPGNW